MYPKSMLVLFVFLLAVVCLAVPGCDEAMNMPPPVITDPVEPTEPQAPTTNGDIKPEPTEPTEEPIQTVVGTINPSDFTGQVFLVNGKNRADAKVLSGTIVTIASGPRSGERFLTNREGRYVFRDIDRDEVRLRAEKEGLEPKEVIVHRSERTTLADGSFFDVDGDPQNNPGNILVGYRWDDRVRFILEETALLPDLLLLLVDELPYAGTYSRHGIITTKYNNNCMLSTVAHEIAHAHQHALSLNELGISSVGAWEDTAEGKAYLKAWKKDWEEVGKMNYDAGRYLIPYENAAETAKHFWGLQGRLDTPRCFLTNHITEKNAPNRLKWAREWLSKKYD